MSPATALDSQYYSLSKLSSKYKNLLVSTNLPRHDQIARKNPPGTFSLTSAKNTLSGSSFVPTNLAACWCPVERCDVSTNGHYMQQIGTVHFYTVKTCRADDAGCATDFIGTTPNIRFKLRIDCPNEACSAGDNQRFKIIARNPTATASYDKPAWDPSNICRSLEHGKNFAGRNIIDMSTNYTNTCTGKDRLCLKDSLRSVCEGATHCGMAGANPTNPVTVKEFPPYRGNDPLLTLDYNNGFRFNSAEHDFERLNFMEPVGLDVCAGPGRGERSARARARRKTALLAQGLC